MTAELVVAGGVSLATGALGFLVGTWRGRVRRREDARAEASRDATQAQHLRRVESRMEDLEAERLYLRDLALGGVHVAPPSGRPRQRDFHALAALLRGLSTVEEACIADSAGLACSPVTTRRGDELAVVGALVLELERRVSSELGGLVEARITLGDAAHVTARPLRGWADGFAVVASAVSQDPNPAALNAVVASIALGAAGRPSLARARLQRPAPAASLHPPGSPSPLRHELARLASVEAFFAQHRGVDGEVTTWTDVRAEVAPSVETLRAIDAVVGRATHALRGGSALRLDLVLAGRTFLTWASAPDGSSLVVTSRGREVDQVVLTRLFGRIARLSGQKAAA